MGDDDIPPGERDLIDDDSIFDIGTEPVGDPYVELRSSPGYNVGIFAAGVLTGALLEIAGVIVVTWLIG